MGELLSKSTQNILPKYVRVVDTKTKKVEKRKLNLFVLPRLAGFATCDFEINADVNAAKNILASARIPVYRGAIASVR